MNKKKYLFPIICFLSALSLLASRNSMDPGPSAPDKLQTGGYVSTLQGGMDKGCLQEGDAADSHETTESLLSDATDAYNWFDSIPEYRGTPYIEVNGNIPFFSDEERKSTEAFEIYSDLDGLGRCGEAFANICIEIMPTEDRESSISSVTPSGWQQGRYDGEWLLNRCHLIGYQLAGENANEKNLISGTRYFNVAGMLPFENTVADYMDDNISNHVLYRVTPIYREKEDLMAYGVLMEAWSVEDNGYGCQFCVFVYNVQPGIVIDYSTGDNWNEVGKVSVADQTYALNNNSMKFYTEDCSNTDRINDKNRPVITAARDDLVLQGYEPASYCNP